MHHTLCNFVALANVADTNVPPIQDGIMAIANNHWLPQRDYDLIYAATMAVTLDRTRLVSPTNRQITIPFVRPTIAALSPPTDPNVADYRKNPFRLRALEEFAFESTDTAAGPNNHYVVSGLQTAFEPMPVGNVFTLRGTSTTAAVAATWTQITVTWADILPAGTYAIVGLDVVSATPVAARLILENQIERPGAIGNALVGSRNHEMFYKGGLGVWGRFKSTRMPIVEIVNDGVIAVHTVYLDMIRVA